jgi:outer membrane protein assembly factor BamB
LARCRARSSAIDAREVADMRNPFLRVLVMASMVALAGRVVSAADWLHWAGPSYNFVSDRGEELAVSWPAEGPRRAWSRSLGAGFSAVLANRRVAYVAFRRGEQELIAALDAATGETRWERAFDTPDHPERRMPSGRPVAGPGPFATPLVSGGRVFLVTSIGVIHAVDERTGALRWTRSLGLEADGPEARPGYASSPLAYKHTIIVPVGGPGRGVVCLRQDDGTVVWSAVDSENAHSSPILIEVAGKPQVVAFMRNEVLGLDPDSGRLLWRYAHPTDHHANIATPVWGPDDLLFISSAYNGGSRGLRLARTVDGTAVTELWHTKRMRIHHGNALRIGGHVYGSNGDFGPAPLTAVDASTGEIVWRDRRFAKATLVGAGARALLLEETGRLALVTLAPEGLTVHAEADVLAATAWTTPTLVGNRLYVRNQKEIAAFDLPTVERR